MTDRIEPALTAEEWRSPPQFDDASGVTIEATDDGLIVVSDTGDGYIVDAFKVMALANHALPADDSRKITRADVEVLKRASVIYRVSDWESATNDDATKKVQRIAAKLAALLPPEE